MSLKLTLSAILLFLGFVFKNHFNNDHSFSINLRFNKNYPTETPEKQKTGLWWALSFLGAALSKEEIEKTLVQKDSVIYELNLEHAGFGQEALIAFNTILVSLKESEEYSSRGGIDLGEFIIYTLCSSWHYYQITGASKTLAAYKQKFDYVNPIMCPVTSSEVSRHHRMLQMTNTTQLNQMSFIAVEGLGSLKEKTFTEETYEVMDIMPNGQFRFAIYDKAGNLSAASERRFGSAGKPIKCLWCHEINLRTLFMTNKQLPGYMRPDSFDNAIRYRQGILNSHRSSLNSVIDFTKLQDHALMEIQYISFMEPSILKLRNEWGASDSSLSRALLPYKKHDHHEHRFLKALYERQAIRSLSPYKTVSIPDSILDPNSNEPNLFE